MLRIAAATAITLSIWAFSPALAADTPAMKALRSSAMEMKRANDPCVVAAHRVTSVSIAAEAGKASYSDIMGMVRNAQQRCATAAKAIRSIANPLSGPNGNLWATAMQKCAAGPQVVSDAYGKYLQPPGSATALVTGINRGAELQAECSVQMQRLAVRLMP